MTDVREVIYQESVRNLDAQAAILDGLRERAGTLLAAAALVTAFLAPPALKVSDSSTGSDYTFGPLAWCATGCFAATVVLALVVLLPRKWTFGHDAHDLMDKFVEDAAKSVDDLHYHLAYYNEDHHRANAGKMGWIFVAFGVGCACLAGETGLWLAAVAH